MIESIQSVLEQVTLFDYIYINFVKNVKPNLIRLNNFGIKNFPVVARKKIIPPIMTIRIKFL